MSESTVWSLGGFSLVKTFWPREPRRPFWRFCSQHHGPSPSSRPDQTCICGLAEHRIPHHIGRLFLLWMGQTKHKSGKKKKSRNYAFIFTASSMIMHPVGLFSCSVYGLGSSKNFCSQLQNSNQGKKSVNIVRHKGFRTSEGSGFKSCWTMQVLKQ